MAFYVKLLFSYAILVFCQIKIQPYLVMLDKFLIEQRTTILSIKKTTAKVFDLNLRKGHCDQNSNSIQKLLLPPTLDSFFVAVCLCHIDFIILQK